MSIIPLPWTKPPLSMNDRAHYMARARKVREVRRVVAALCAEIEPMPAAVLTLHYQPRDKRRRDTDNLFATVKACADGIRDAGLIPDDDTRYLSHREPVIHQPAKGQPGRLWLELTPREETP